MSNILTLIQSADGLVEDTRFNGPAQDGAKYTDDGIYTIEVKNEYTGQKTVKKIYVGTNNVLRAHMTTRLSIHEINRLVNQGATITDDGKIQPSSIAQTASEPTTEKSDETTATKEPTGGFLFIPVVGIAIICVIVVVAMMAKKKKRTNPVSVDDIENIEGSTEE